MSTKKYVYRFDWASGGIVQNSTGVNMDGLTKRMEDLAREIVRRVNRGDAVQLIVTASPMKDV